MALFYILDHERPASPGSYGLHDIVEVVDDCAVVRPPAAPFYIVRVIGVTRAQVERFLEQHIDATDPARPQLLKRRKWKLDVAVIPTAWKNALLLDRYNECTLAQARKYALNKVTGLHDDGS